MGSGPSWINDVHTVIAIPSSGRDQQIRHAVDITQHRYGQVEATKAPKQHGCGRANFNVSLALPGAQTSERYRPGRSGKVIA